MSPSCGTLVLQAVDNHVKRHPFLPHRPQQHPYWHACRVEDRVEPRLEEELQRPALARRGVGHRHEREGPGAVQLTHGAPRDGHAVADAR
eukprot:4737182-Pyramimonas_sp.AAC.1